MKLLRMPSIRAACMKALGGWLLWKRFLQKISQDPFARSSLESHSSTVPWDSLRDPRLGEAIVRDLVKMCLYENFGRMLLGVSCARYCWKTILWNSSWGPGRTSWSKAFVGRCSPEPCFGPRIFLKQENKLCEVNRVLFDVWSILKSKKMDDVLAPKLLTVRQPSEQYDSKCSWILDFQPSFNTVDLQTTRTNRFFFVFKIGERIATGFCWFRCRAGGTRLANCI